MQIEHNHKWILQQTFPAVFTTSADNAPAFYTILKSILPTTFIFMVLVRL